jgi:hypothetical protein
VVQKNYCHHVHDRRIISQTITECHNPEDHNMNFNLFCELFSKVLCLFRLQDIALFKQLLANDEYKADPITSISSHIHTKVYEEVMNDT